MFRVIVLAPLLFFATTYYVRPNGGTMQQCNGKFDVDYSAAVAPNCAWSGKDLQAAINAITFGDTLALDSKGTFSTTPDYPFGEFALPDKGTPPTNTDADYMTITTNDPSGIPAALSGYPANDVKITRAMMANMPTVVAEGSTPVFRFKSGSKYWRLKGLHLRNDSTNGWQTVVFIDTDEITSLGKVPHHLDLGYLVIEPDEEKGEAFTATNIARSAENAIFLTATDFHIHHIAMQGFEGRFRYGSEAGQPMTSAGVLIGTYAERGLIENNYIDPWTYGFFSGGSSMPDWTVTQGAQVVSCASATVCTFTTTSGAVIGDPLAIKIGEVWGSAFVTAIDGNTVTLDRSVCHSFDGGNTCTTVSANPPPAGSPVRFKGIQPKDITISRNLFKHYDEVTPLLNGQRCGKGDLEVKAGINLKFIGNIFDCAGPTVTVRNQTGDFPYASLDGLTFQSNLWRRSIRMFTSFLRDDTPTKKSQNARWTNNLIFGLQGNPANFPGGELSGATTGGINTTFDHNTVAWSKTSQSGMTLTGWHDFVSFFKGGTGTMEGFVFRDNVIPLGINLCFDGNNTISVTKCWPSADVRNNVFVNVDGHVTSDISLWWSYPNNKIASGYGGLFVAPNPTMTIGGDYRPAGALKGGASDGGDIGYNHQKLVADMGFDYLTNQPAPSPSATPTPSPTASPSPSVSPVPSPSPSPAPSATPSTPIGFPVGTNISIISRANVREGPSVNSPEKFIAEAGLQGVTIATCQQDTASENAYCPVTFIDARNGYVASQFLQKEVAQPSPSPTPVPSPTVTPTPTPAPSPSPSPSPSPLPSPELCVMTVTAPTLTQWSTGTLQVKLTISPARSFSVSAIGTSGQVSVLAPTTKSFTNVTSTVVEFKLQSKKKSGNVTVSGPCGSQTVLVNVQ